VDLVILSSVACITIPYFSTLSYILHDFRGKKKLLNKRCVLTSCKNFVEMFLILRNIQRGIIINVHRSSGKVLVILVRY
jgi:hypothetical protein